MAVVLVHPFVFMYDLEHSGFDFLDVVAEPLYPVGGELCEEPVAGAPLVGDLPFGRRIAERRALRDEQGPVGKQVAQVGAACFAVGEPAAFAVHDGHVKGLL